MGSFRKRLLVLIIGLIIVTQTVTLAAVLASTAHDVQARAAEQLRSGGSFVQQLIQFRATQLANGVAVLASDFGFREAVATADAPTILSAATNNSQRIGADMVLVLDTHGRALVSTPAAGSSPSDGAASAAGSATAAGTSFASLLEEPRGIRDLPHFAVLGNHAYQFFLAPVKAPETIAWVAMVLCMALKAAARLRNSLPPWASTATS